MLEKHTTANPQTKHNANTTLTQQHKTSLV